MRPTLRLLAADGFPNFFKRSLDEFQRLSRIAVTFQGIKGPEGAMPLWNFDSPDSIKSCAEMCDKDIGGSSDVQMQFVPETSEEPPHLLFSGSISNELPSDDPEVEQTGYAAFRTRERPRTMFGKPLWDVDSYEYLGMRIKSDGRKYKFNIQTESIVHSDIHQHRIYAKEPGQWETILIKWRDFVRTNQGFVVEPQSEILKEKVRTIGIGLTDRVPGPFELRVSEIWATNGYTKKEVEEIAQRHGLHFIPKHLLHLAPQQNPGTTTTRKSS